MKRIKIFFVALVSFCFSANAQDMASVFTAMPDSHIPLLESAWRKDLVDLFNTGKQARLQNSMSGYSTLKNLTNDYLLLQITENSTLEMKLLPLINKTYLICMIVTVDGPAPDSRISFYSTDWQVLESSALFTPVSADWFIKEDADKTSFQFESIISHLDIELTKYTLSPDDLSLTAHYTTPLYLSKNEREKLTQYIKETPKHYTWELSRFK